MRKDISHKIAVVTSFNNKLFDKYAKRTIATYSWPFPLYIYSEYFDGGRLLEMESLGSKTVKVRNIFELDPECKDFVARNSYRKVPISKSGFEDYLYDGVRFCYKPFSVAHFILNDCDYDIVIWIDADVVWSRKKMTEEFVFNSLTGDDIMLSYFGRNFMHSECGFLVFNLKHPRIDDYLVKMRNMYITDEIYKIKEQHDSYVWDYVRVDFEQEYAVKNKNLSGDYEGDIHPMAYSFMNVYFDHLKGNNKHRLHHPTWLKNKGVEFLQ